MDVRKNIFLLIAFFLVTGRALHAQADSTYHYNIRKVLLSEARYATDVAKNLEERAVPVRLFVQTTLKGNAVRLESAGNQLSDAVKIVMVGAQPGSKIFCHLKFKVRGDSTNRMRDHVFVITVVN